MTVKSKRIKLKYNSIFIFILIFINSQTFAFSVNNPYGIKGVTELFSIFLLLYSIYFFCKKSLKINKIDLIVFITPIVLILMSAFIANLYYGQPIIAGIIEERRMLGLYIYFPLIKHFRDPKKNIDELYTYIIASSLIAMFMGLLYQLDIFKGFNITTSSLTQFRQDRATTGNLYMVISVVILYCHLIFKVDNKAKNISLLIIFITSLLIISQSRGVFISLILVLILINKNTNHAFQKLSYLSLSFFSLLLIILSFNINLPFFDKLIEPFTKLTSESYIAESVRTQTISKIISDLNFFGHGALWLQWNNGFIPYYGEYFFLSDVGIWGTFFRYGIFSIVPLIIYLLFAKKILLKAKGNKNSLIAFGIFLHITLMMPIAGAFEYRSFIVAIAIVIYRLSNIKTQEKQNSN